VKVDVVTRPANCDSKPKTEAGDYLSVHYTGRLEDGSSFDSSRGKDPFGFQLGMGRVIAGWDKGLQGMCEGEKRLLTIPPGYAYGEQGHPPVIPPRATLTFEVELIKFSKTPPPQKHVDL